MKKGCLARGLAWLLFFVSLGFGGATYYLWGRTADLQSQLDQARAQIAADAAAGSHKGVKGAPESDDWLNQAQKHANNAAQAVKNLDLSTAYNESQAAFKSLGQQPKHMSAEMRKRYDSVKKQLAGIEDRATSAFHKLPVVGGG